MCEHHQAVLHLYTLPELMFFWLCHDLLPAVKVHIHKRTSITPTWCMVTGAQHVCVSAFEVQH